MKDDPKRLAAPVAEDRHPFLAEQLADLIGPISTRRDRIRIILAWLDSNEFQPKLEI